jgi:hypothetical protein
MFISAKRHEREIQATLSAGNRWTEAVLSHVSQGIFFIDVKNRLLPSVSQSLSTLFRRRDFAQLTFEKLLRPVIDEQTLTDACAQLAELRAAAERGELSIIAPLQSVEVRLLRADGGFDSMHLDGLRNRSYVGQSTNRCGRGFAPAARRVARPITNPDRDSAQPHANRPHALRRLGAAQQRRHEDDQCDTEEAGPR